MTDEIRRTPSPEHFIMVLDTGAFISGVSQQMPGKIVTAPSVLKEIRSTSAKLGLARLRAASRLQIVVPTKRALARIHSILKRTQDSFVISDADKDILALAYDYHLQRAHVRLITDDYAVQNIARILKIPYSAYGQRGIKEVWTWEVYCPACFRTYPQAQLGERCQVCETPLKRRRRKSDGPRKTSEQATNHHD